MSPHEDLGVVAPIDRVGAEQAAEQQDLRREEEPHAELARIELLDRRVEMVLQERRVVAVPGLVLRRIARAPASAGLRTYPPTDSS